jgi:hypothetical protein
MGANQEGVHSSVRAATGTSLDYLSDWHALFTANSVAAGPWNERMLKFLNTNLGTTYVRLTDAMNAFAISQGFPGGWADMNSFTLSAAAAMLAAETQGLAFDFTDDAFFGRDGFYGSAEIKDTGTPANNYSAAPTKTASSLLTYTSPSPKMVMGPSGTLRFQAHNLYLNSASPANQSITVVSSATYAVTITGTVSVTASGAATGTWTAGTQTFTAATTTLTFGSTSGAGTVHVRRTPSDSTYLATAGSQRFALPLEWSSAGVQQGLLVEEARTNVLTRSNEFTQAVWVKTAATVNAVAAQAPFTDFANVFNLVPSVANVTNHRVVQDAASRAAFTGSVAYSIYAKPNGYNHLAIRESGTTGATVVFVLSGAGSNFAVHSAGNVTFSSPSIVAQPNGWYRCSVVATAAVATNIRPGFYVTTSAYVSGDVESVSFAGDGTSGILIAAAQDEVGAFPTSHIECLSTSTVTRAADNISLATTAFPFSTATGTMYVNGTASYVAANNKHPLTVGISGRIIIAANTVITNDGTTSVGSRLVAANTTFEIAATYTGSTQAISVNGAAVESGSFDGTYGAAGTLFIGIQDVTAVNPHTGLIRKIMVLPRAMSAAEAQTLTTP